MRSFGSMRILKFLLVAFLSLGFGLAIHVATIAALPNSLTQTVSQIEQNWQKQYETYYGGKLKTQLLDLPAIQQRLAQIDRISKTHSALIYAVPQQEKLQVILVPPAGQAVEKIVELGDAKTLTQTANALRLSIVNSQTSPSEYLPPAQQLYNWLIRPVAADLQQQQIDTLIFCLGTGLRSVPLAALHDGQQFLVEQYNLALIPAFNLLDHRPSILSGTQVLATGASEFPALQPLEAVPIELATITQDLWPGTMLLNQSFTLKNLLAARTKTPYGIVHLATHADISAKSVEDSYIQFWDRSINLQQMRELRLDMPIVQLLVLSACRTALGTPNAELGFAGLAVQSGAKSVLASLWAVDDVGTLVLMSKFYEQLKTAPIKATALRAAQIAMLKGQLNIATSPAIARIQATKSPEIAINSDEKLVHPYFWASFEMIGNPW
jgi:CHAT domain-containing protein